MENDNTPMDYDVQDELHSHHHGNTSTPQRSRSARRIGPVWSDYETDTSDLDQESLDDDKEERANGGHPLLLSRTQLQRLESIMSTASRRSSGRERYDNIMDDFEEADEDLKEFALEYAKDIVAKSEAAILAEDEGEVTGADNSQLLDQIFGQQEEMSDDTQNDQQIPQSHAVSEETTFFDSGRDSHADFDKSDAVFNISVNRELHSHTSDEESPAAGKRSEKPEEAASFASDNPTSTFVSTTLSNPNRDLALDRDETPTLDDEISVLSGEPVISNLVTSVGVASEQMHSEESQNMMNVGLPSLGDRAMGSATGNDQTPFNEEHDPFTNAAMETGVSSNDPFAVGNRLLGFEDNFLSLAPDASSGSSTTAAAGQGVADMPSPVPERPEGSVLQSTITIDDETTDTDVAQELRHAEENSPDSEEIEQRLDALRRGDEEGAAQVEVEPFDGYISSESDVNDNIITDLDDFRSLNMSGIGTTVDDPRTDLVFTESGDLGAAETGLLDWKNKGGQSADAEEQLQETRQKNEQQIFVEFQGSTEDGTEVSSNAKELVEFAETPAGNPGSSRLDDQNTTAEEGLSHFEASTTESFNQDFRTKRDSTAEVAKETDLFRSSEVEKEPTPEGAVDEGAMHSKPDVDKESSTEKLDYYGRRYSIKKELDRPPVVEDTMTFSSTIAVHSEPPSPWNVEVHLQTPKKEEVGIPQMNVDEQSSTTEGPNKNANQEQAELSKFGGFELSEDKDDTNRNEDAVNEDSIVVSSAVAVHAEPSSWSGSERINLNTGFETLPSFDNQDADGNRRAQLSTQFDESGETEGDRAQEHLEKTLELSTDKPGDKDSVTDSNISVQKDEEGAAEVQVGSFDGYISSESDVNDQIITDLDDFRNLDISGIGTTVAEPRADFVYTEKRESEECATGLVISHRAGLLDFENETDQKAGTEEELLETKEIDEQRSSIEFKDTDAKVSSLPDATASIQKASLSGELYHVEQTKESPVEKLDYYGRRYEVSEELDRPPVVEDTMTFSSSIAVHSEPPSLWNVEGPLQTQKNEEVNISQINVDEQVSTTEGPNASQEQAELSKFGGFEMSEGKDDTNRNEDAVNEDTIVVSSAIAVHIEPRSWSDLERINLNTGFESLPSFDNQDAHSNRAQLSTQFDEFDETENDAAPEHLAKTLKLTIDKPGGKDSITDDNISAQKDEEGAAKVEDGSFDGYISSESDVNDKIITDLDDFRSLDISGIGTTVADSRTGFVFREKHEAEESETGLVISHRAGLLDFEHETDQKAGTEEELLETKEIDGKRSSIEFENTAKEKVEVSSMAESLAEVAELQPSNSGRFGLDDQDAAIEESLSSLAVSTTEGFNQEIQKGRDSTAEAAKETDLFSSPEVKKKFKPEGTVDEGAMHSKPNVDKEEPSEQLTATLDRGAAMNLLPSAIPDASTLNLDSVKYDQPSSGFEVLETPNPQVSFELNLRDIASIPEDNETSASDVPHDRFRSMFPHSEESDVDTTLEVGEKFQDDNSGNPTEKQTELCEMEPSTSGTSGEIQTDLASKYTIPSISEADSEPLNVTEPSSDPTKMSAYSSSNAGSLMENDLEDIEAGAPTFQSKENIKHLDEENSQLPVERGDDTGLSLADELAQAMGDEDDASNDNVSDFGGGDLSMHQDPDNLGKADVTLVKPALWDDTFGRDTTINHNTDSESRDVQMDDAQHQEAEFAESKSVNEKKTDVETNVDQSPVVANLQLAGYTSLEASAAKVTSPPDATVSTQKASMFGDSHHIEQMKESPVAKLDYYGRRYEVSEEPDRPPVVEDTMTFSSSIAVHSEPLSLWNVEEHLQTQKKEEVNISQINVDEQSKSSTTAGPNASHELAGLSKFGGFEMSEDKDDTNRNEDAVNEDTIVVSSAISVHAEPSSWSDLERINLNTGFKSLPSFDNQDADSNRAQLSTQFDEFGETEGDAAQEHLEKNLKLATDSADHKDSITDSNISAQKDEEGAAKVEDGSFDGYISSESDVNDKIITDLDDFRSLDISGIGTTVADSRTGFVFREKQEAEESETGLVISHRAGLLDFEHETDQKAGTEEELLETKEIDEKRSSIAFENTAKEKVEVSSMAESLAEVAELQPSNSGRFGWDDQNAAVEESLSNLAVSTTESFNQEIQKEQDSPAEIAKETDLFSSPEVEKKFEPEGTVDEGAMHSKPNVDKEEPSEQLTAKLDGGAAMNLLPSAIPDASTLHLDGVKHDQPSSGFEMPETPDPQVSFELNLRDIASVPEDNETSASDVPHDRLRSMFPHSEESDVDTTLEMGEKFQDDNSGNPTEKQTELCEMEPSTSGASGEIQADQASKYTIPPINEADSEPPSVTEPSSDSTKMSAYGSSNAGSLMENDLEDIETGAPTFQSKNNIDYLEEENSRLPDEKGDNTCLSLADELAQAMGDEDDASNANVSDFGGGDLSMHQDPDNLGKADVTLVKPALWDDTFGRDTTFNHNTDSENGDAQMDDAQHRGAEFAESKSINEKKADVEINVNLSPVVADLQLAGYTSLEASAAEVSSPPDATASTQKASLFGESHHIEQTKESPVEKLDYYGRRYEVSEELDRPPVVEDTMTFSSSIAVHSEPPSLWNVEEHLQTQKKEEVNISQINVDEQSSTTEGPNSNQEQTELSKLGGFETSEDKEDTNRKEDAVNEDMIVVSSAAAIHAEPSSWSGLEPFDLNMGFESLPSCDDQDADSDRAQLSTQLDESGETKGDAAQEFLEKTLEFAIGKQVGEDFDTDTNISDPAASVTERKESIQVQLQTLNDSKEAEPKYSMESWNSQEELSVDLEAEQIQPESFKQTYSSLHRQNSFSSDDEQVRGSLQENETETVETGKSGTNKDLGVLSMSVQENRFEDESSAADVALGAPQENIAELADEAKSLPVEEPEKKENYNEETFAPSLEQPRVEGREETQEASSNDIVPINIGKDEEISSENSDVGIRKVTLKLLDAQDVKVESELRQRNQENGNMTAEPVMQSSNGENGSKNSLEPIGSSSIMLGLASDSTDMLADKLDELNTPSIETRELDLSDSMLNVMIDGPDMEQPIRRQTARGLESEALPNQSHSRQATFDLSNSLSLSSPEQTAQTEAEIIDVEIDGQTMQLNMAIASQYKEVFTHGGYTDRTQQQAIVILSACEFPTRRTPNYAQIMDQLFIYVYHKVREIDAPEYALIYLQGGASKSQLPAMKWMKRCHDHLSRSIRKSIKILFIVHPTFWTRTVIFWSRPFVSSKFMRKLHLSPTLEHVNKILSLRDVPIPGKVRMYDATFKR